MTGSTTTRAAVVQGRLSVVQMSDSQASGIGAVMAMGSATVEEWYMSQEPDPDTIPPAERG